MRNEHEHLLTQDSSAILLIHWHNTNRARLADEKTGSVYVTLTHQRDLGVHPINFRGYAGMSNGTGGGTFEQTDLGRKAPN